MLRDVEGSFAAVFEQDEHGAGLSTCSLNMLDLDLTAASGRAHAAWWLADQLASDPMGMDTYSPFFDAVAWANEGDDDEGAFLGWMLNAPAGRWHFLSLDCLHDLDPYDPHLLEDGSRWVDAEALRLVCLHVAGGGK